MKKFRSVAALIVCLAFMLLCGYYGRRVAVYYRTSIELAYNQARGDIISVYDKAMDIVKQALGFASDIDLTVRNKLSGTEKPPQSTR